MQEFYSDLANKVSIDQEFISLNAFELFTRQRGLSRGLSDLLQDVTMRSKAQRSIRLNDTIVAELSEVKQMLDLKSSQINAREADLKKRELAFNK